MSCFEGLPVSVAYKFPFAFLGIDARVPFFFSTLFTPAFVDFFVPDFFVPLSKRTCLPASFEVVRSKAAVSLSMLFSESFDAAVIVDRAAILIFWLAFSEDLRVVFVIGVLGFHTFLQTFLETYLMDEFVFFPFPARFGRAIM